MDTDKNHGISRLEKPLLDSLTGREEIREGGSLFIEI
jgi:hypothetical protein